MGVVGHTLGGGVGWLARRYGLAANSVLAAEIVTADGVLRRVDATTHPDLFWAIRGGGGSFGVVTALQFRLYPVERVYAGSLFFPVERASEVLHAYRRWTHTVPDGVTSMGRLLHFPPLPEVPEPFRGHAFVLIEAACLGDQADADERLRPLRALGPVMDTFAMVPAPALGAVNMDPEDPAPGIGDHVLVGDLTAEALDALLGVVGPASNAPLASVEIRHLGGAFAHSAPDHGALDQLAAAFVVFALGVPVIPEMTEAIDGTLVEMTRALRPWSTGVSYPNFADRATTTEALHGDGVAERLHAVKAAWDPEELFVSNHPVHARR